MLILTRKEDEAIVVDDQIKVKVLEVKGGRVQLGIEAPRSIAIHREEVYHKIQAENKEAAQIKGGLAAELLKKAREQVRD
ncbi:carbon storage regulator CsrA [Natroniella acetigena]|uniref:carbon storage regulator CsrA n=1 Tax=Natroniella acetigena TaxID=52004 RepID=UPI0024A924A2|nr:carbon storage regulator CsrA [Natroniella acetigena]